MKKAVVKTARKKAIDKDVATSKKISSFFTKKSSESISIINHEPVNSIKEENHSNNKRKNIEFEEKSSLEHSSKLRKVESHSALGCKTPIKMREKSKSDSKIHSMKVQQTQRTDSPNKLKPAFNSTKNSLPQIPTVHKSTKDSHLSSLNLDSDLVSKNVLKEKVISDEDSGIVTKEEENTNSNSLNDTLTGKCISNGLNKENSLDNKCDKKLTVDTNLSDLGDEMDNFFGDNWDDDFSEDNLDLSTIKRCDVLGVVKNGRDIILSLKNSISKEKASARCCDYWASVEVEKGQVVSIQASKINGEWIVNNTSGLLITQPDVLISGTSVVGALFCNRKSVLKEKFRGFESLPQVQSDGSNYMTVGLLVHNILQKTLELKVETLPGITKIYEEIIQSFDAISLMHHCKMSIQDCRAQVKPYIPQIYNFIQRYMKGIKPQSADKNFEGQISSIRDIEENIWLPQLGLKGKIDVSVEVNINSRRKIMPLELKTGKSSFSPEHKGQVILYTMMMSMIGQQVGSGLLLYLKENEMKEVSGSHHEQRDLLMLRNTLSHYLSKKSNVNVDNFDDIKELLLDLPEPINHRNACTSCPVNQLCAMYLNHDETFSHRDSSHPMKALSEKLLSHLKPEHINYVMKWVKLHQIEEEANNTNFSMKDMWTMEPLQREKKGLCISNLKVVHVEKIGERYSHTFEKTENLIGTKDFTRSEINENDYVVINTEKRINISSGFITEMSSNSITIYLERNLKDRYPGTIFHVDKYFSANISNYNRAGVGGLLADDELCSRLRSIVIEKKPATFKNQLPRSIAPISAPILKRLNKQQQRAIFRILTSREYALLKGMPGTGKTRTMVALVELLVKMGKSVLITANTHSAVDNILIGLVERDIDFLRLGSQAKVHPSLTNYSESALTAQCKTPESLEDVYASKKVVGVTCLGAYHKLFESRKFDFCLVDESTQVQQCTVLKPLYNSEKFVLVGDPEQLPPIAKSETARQLGFNESLFARLDSENNTIVLFAQYRMNREIMNLANKLTYKDQLEVGDEKVENATLPVKNIELLQTCDWWIQEALSVNIENSVIFLNTSIPKDLESQYENVDKDNKTYTNRFEVAVVQCLVKALAKIGLNNNDIGIMAPFRAQVSLLGKAVPKDVEVNTVDQYQGREKNIIIYSCTESSPQGCANTRAFHILDDHNRLTVAVTRAKRKLVMIGDKNILETYSPFGKLLRFVKEENMIDLFNSQKPFDWKEMMDSYKIKSKTC